MRAATLAICVFSFSALPALAQDTSWQWDLAPPEQLQGYEPSTYGPSIGSDNTGRPVHTATGSELSLDRYGPGIHSDQTGKAIRRRSINGVIACR
jgi:hypothetical protein